MCGLGSIVLVGPLNIMEVLLRNPQAPNTLEATIDQWQQDVTK
jgi:hypothetical protein